MFLYFHWNCKMFVFFLGLIITTAYQKFNLLDLVFVSSSLFWSALGHQRNGYLGTFISRVELTYTPTPPPPKNRIFGAISAALVLIWTVICLFHNASGHQRAGPTRRNIKELSPASWANYVRSENIFFFQPASYVGPGVTCSSPWTPLYVTFR